MEKKDIIEIIPLAILTFIALYSVVEVLTTDYLFDGQQYIGLTLLGVSIILFFLNRITYKYIFGITVILGLLNLVGFTTSIFSFSFFGLPIQILMLPLILIFTWINKEQIKPKIHDFLGNSEVS